MPVDLSRRTLLALGGGMAAAAPAIRLPGKIRLALVGLDGHPGEILDRLPDAPDVELAAFTDTDKEGLERARKNKRLANVRFYPDLRSLLETESRLDVVAVCNNNGQRAAAVIAALERGAHVIAEKPLALQSADLERIRRLRETRRLHLGMLLPMRFDSPYLALREVVSSGRIGQVIQIGSQKSYKHANQPKWKIHRATYGSTIAWIGIHMIDLMRWTSGREFTDVFSRAGHVAFPEIGDMENVTASTFGMDNGGLAILRMDFLRPTTAKTHGDDRLRLAGTEGVVEYQAATGVTLLTGKGGEETLREFPARRSVFLDFLDHAFNGKPTALPLDDIFRVNELTIAAQRSVELGRVVQMQRKKG